MKTIISFPPNGRFSFEKTAFGGNLISIYYLPYKIIINRQFFRETEDFLKKKQHLAEFRYIYLFPLRICSVQANTSRKLCIRPSLMTTADFWPSSRVIIEPFFWQCFGESASKGDKQTTWSWPNLLNLEWYLELGEWMPKGWKVTGL